jgi:capsid portal protein
LALLVSGGSLAEGTDKIIGQYLEENVKGAKSFSSILIIEAESDPSEHLGIKSNTKMEFKDLTMSQRGDGLFLEYTENCAKNIQSAFRIPPLYIGRVGDYNKATAETARAIAEEQIFIPERTEFDAKINRTVLADMGINYWKFESLGPKLANKLTLTDIIDKLSDSALTPREQRIVIRDILNMELPDSPGAEWMDKPIKLTIEELKLAAKTQGNSPEALTRALLDVRKNLEQRLIEAENESNTGI